MGPEPGPPPDPEDGPRTTEAVERAAGARLLQQHGLRLALTHPPNAREGSHPLLRQDRRGSEQEEDRACAAPGEVVDSKARSKSVRLVGLPDREVPPSVG